MPRKLEVAEFGGLVAGLRRTRGLTQEALADRSGVSVRTIRNLEAGRVSRPRPASVSLLANALELNGPQRTTFEMTAWSDGGMIAWSDDGAAASWVAGSDRVPDDDDAGDPAAFPPGSASSGPGRHPLVESLIGREADIARLLRIVPETPLVLLTGPGGVGKTRLAIATAHLMAPGYPDGVRVAQLGALAAESAPEDVARALLHGLGAAVPQHGALATLTRVLTDRQVLLVVDTAEHVARGVARVAEHLLLACPHLHMIVTSRRSFSMPSQYVYEVLPLAASSAAQLFMRRTAEQCPGLDLADQQDMVTALCERLDGLPLAIEWAVGWLRSISADVLLQRLNPDMLGMPVMTGLPHQQRLTTSVNWSLDLITGEQRRLLAGLARFTGYIDLAEVEQLAGSGDLAGVDLDAELAALVSNSLVQVIRGRSYRYRLLHLIRDCLTSGPLHVRLPSALSSCRDDIGSGPAAGASAGGVEDPQRALHELRRRGGRRQYPQHGWRGQAPGEQQAVPAAFKQRHVGERRRREFEHSEKARSPGCGDRPGIRFGDPLDAFGERSGRLVDLLPDRIEVIERGQPRGAGQRMAAEGRRMEERIAHERSEQRGCAHHRRQRHDPPAESLAEQDRVRREPVLDGQRDRSAAAQSHLDLVRDDENTGCPRVRAPAPEQFRRQHPAAALTLDRLEDESRERGFPDGLTHRVLAQRQMTDGAEELADWLPALGVGRHGESAHGLAVKAALDRQHPGVPGLGDGQLERGLHRVGAIEAEHDAAERARIEHGGQALGQQRAIRIDEHPRGRGAHLERLMHGSDHGFRPVTEEHHGIAAEVDEGPPVRQQHLGSFGRRLEGPAADEPLYLHYAGNHVLRRGPHDGPLVKGCAGHQYLPSPQ